MAHLCSVYKKITDSLICRLSGIQQAPAIGRAIAELIIDGDYQSIDLSRFDFSRILHDIREREVNIV